jgi:hypothetical protein
VAVVETGLVALDEVELRGAREVAEGAGEEIEFGAGIPGAGVHFVLEHLVLDGEGAAQMPGRDRHFLDHAEFELVFGANWS